MSQRTSQVRHLHTFRQKKKKISLYSDIFFILLLLKKKKQKQRDVPLQACCRFMEGGISHILGMDH